MLVIAITTATDLVTEMLMKYGILSCKNAQRFRYNFQVWLENLLWLPPSEEGEAQKHDNGHRSHSSKWLNQNSNSYMTLVWLCLAFRVSPSKSRMYLTPFIISISGIGEEANSKWKESKWKEENRGRMRKQARDSNSTTSEKWGTPWEGTKVTVDD